jgi:hypothetical protein
MGAVGTCVILLASHDSCLLISLGAKFDQMNLSKVGTLC